MKLIKDNLMVILAGLIIIVATLIIVSTKHKKNLLEVARFSQFVGCLQVTNNNDAICSKLVAATPQDKIILDILDTRTDEGQDILTKSKKTEGSPNGQPIFN